MKPRCFGKIFAFSCLVAFLSLCEAGFAWSAGTMRLTTTDGRVIEVPCYWISGGQVKFDIPGGVAGIPRSQLASVQEILETKEFDPKVIRDNAAAASDDEQRQVIQDAIAAKTPGSKSGITGFGEETRQPGAVRTIAGEEEKQPRIYGQKYRIEKSLPMVSDEPGGPVYILQNIISCKTDSIGRSFNLILYDADGNELGRKNCEVYPLNLDQNARKKLQLKGRLFIVRAGIKPDPKIKRYEITAVGQ